MLGITVNVARAEVSINRKVSRSGIAASNISSYRKARFTKDHKRSSQHI